MSEHTLEPSPLKIAKSINDPALLKSIRYELSVDHQRCTSGFNEAVWIALCQRLEHAEFLARVVNCHDQLVEALTNLLGDVQLQGALAYDHPDIRRAEAALTAAEAKP